MKTRDLRTFSSDVEDVNKLQAALVDCLKPLTSSTLSNVALLSDIALVSGVPSQVAHKLGRELQGWIVVAPNAAAHIFELARNSKTVTLQASADVTLSFLVF